MLGMEVEKLQERRHQPLIVCYLHLHKTRMAGKNWRKNRKGGYEFYYEGYGRSKNRDLSRWMQIQTQEWLRHREVSGYYERWPCRSLRLLRRQWRQQYERYRRKQCPKYKLAKWHPIVSEGLLPTSKPRIMIGRLTRMANIRHEYAILATHESDS